MGGVEPAGGARSSGAVRTGLPGRSQKSERGEMRQKIPRNHEVFGHGNLRAGISKANWGMRAHGLKKSQLTFLPECDQNHLPGP